MKPTLDAIVPQQSEEIAGAEILMRSLVEHGVDVVFGYPGGAIMPVYDALYHYQDRIRHVLVRHEQGATHAAEGYARVTGRCGVAIATSGPGATNLVTGIADALMDSTPLVCITGQVGRALLGTDAFQETDIIGVTVPITKWNYQVTSADEIAPVMAKAFAIALAGRPGPVVVDITKNAQLEKAVYRRANYTPPQRSFHAVPVAEDYDRAAQYISEAKRPMMLVGRGVLVARAQRELLHFAEKTGIPVALTLQGLSAFPTRHPLYAGMLGMHGNYAPNILTNEADLLIAVGMRFDDRVTGNVQTYAKRAKIIHIDIERAEINKLVSVDVGLRTDAREGLLALTQRVSAREHPEWRERFATLYEEERGAVISHELFPESGGLRMAEVIHRLSEATAGDAITVTDVGQHQMATARYYRYARTDGWISSGGLGTMGFGIPAALGAAIAAPDRTVLAIVGDGGFQMTCQELGTIAQEKTPVKIVIMNNNFLGMVRQWQELFFDSRYSFVHLDNPDFVKLSEAFGIPARRVSEREKLDETISWALATEGPCLIEVQVEKEENVFPMIPAGAGVSEIRLG
jgi:acetolactate synthase-1/2/3 large subunit